MVDQENPFLAAAQAYIARGFRVIPLNTAYNLTCSCKEGKTCGSMGKHPIRNGWQTAKQPGIPAQENWWAGEKPRNIGIVTGPDSGIFVLDVDGERGQASLAALIAKNGPLPRTLTRKTGSGGWHFYFEYPDFEVGNTASTKLGKGLDTRGKGGFVVAPPSVSGVPIDPNDKAGPKRLGYYTDVPQRGEEIAPAPDWLLDLLRPKERQAPATGNSESTALTSVTDPDEIRRLAGYTEGAVANEIRRLQALHPEVWDGNPWNNTVFEVSANLIQLAIADWNDYGSAWQDVMKNAPRDPGFDDEIINRTFESAKRKVEGQPAAYPPKPADISEFFQTVGGNPLSLIPSAQLPAVDPQALSSDNGSGDDDLFVSNVELGTMAPTVEPIVVGVDMAVGGVPVDPDTMALDPDYVAREVAAQAGINYRAELEHDTDFGAAFEPPLDALIDRPEAAEAADLSDLDAWIDLRLRSGSPELLWRCLRAAYDGLDPDAPTIVFKGGYDLLGAVATVLRPAIGDDPETLLFGPRVTTREVHGEQIVLAFDEEDCPDLHGRELAVIARIIATPSTPLTVPPVHEEADVHLPDYRAAQLERTKVGQPYLRREGVRNGSQDAS